MKQRKDNDKQPFSHQQEAFAALSRTLSTPISGYKGTLIVLPTGGGKTFTSVNWICRNILSKGIKVLWLAQSSYLIDQAADTFIKEIHNAVGRNQINLRVVSSNNAHSNSGSILTTDDVLICTTQTAVSAYSSEQINNKGDIVNRPFRRFIEGSKELFIVVDEAHHTPAYGCRNLLLTIREKIQDLYILGLTATPMHMDKRISGWLKNIYDKWICYEADKNFLQANKVLSVPKYIEVDTGIEFEVDDGLFDRLVYKHKDLPEDIVENLANNQSRNNFIISDYINNRKDYGKTLIFADRWFQCEYLSEQLKRQGIKAGAIYSVVTGQDKLFDGGRGRRNDEENRKILKDFRDGKLDVLVNVKMLTEGVDVPDVKTVMITRQTTSNILLTQMIGRALRGEKAGGGTDKDYANIVFFHDSWKRLLPWANVDGGTDATKPAKQGRNPMLLISIHLIKLATADIEFKGFENASFLTFLPTGFYSCEYTIAIEDSSEQEMITFAESVIVYEFNRNNYERLVNHLSTQDLTQYASESLADTSLVDVSEQYVNKFFESEVDNFDGLLVENITKIIRHIAQNSAKPIFVDFHERDLYDLDRVADELLNTPPLDADILLTNKFNDAGMLWQFFYKSFDNFMNAYYKSQKRVLANRRGQPPKPEIKPVDIQEDELTDEIKRQVFVRDSYTCLCCGKEQRKGVSLNVDHIQPIAMGGKNALSNLQTLCRHCNTVKGINEIDYRTTTSPLRKTKNKLNLNKAVGSDHVENAVARIVNEFYHCRAQCALNYHERRNGQYYSEWEIVLFTGNNPDWLVLHIPELLGYVNSHLGWDHVLKITVKN
jgi:superfamily II DNA or RNA helicase